MVRKSVRNDNYRNKDQKSTLKPTISHKQEQRNINFDSSVILSNYQKRALRFNVFASVFDSIHVAQRAVSSSSVRSKTLKEKTAIKDKL